MQGPLANLVTLDVSEAAHDLHEDLFNVLLVLIGLHVAAILFYRLVQGKKLLGPMITGRVGARTRRRADAAGRRWDGIALPACSNRHHPLGHCRRAAIRALSAPLIGCSGRPTSPGC